MEFMKKMVAFSCLLAFFTFNFMGCEKEGPAEKAGKKLDQAFDSAKKKVEEATE